jgi:hypothetical protein
MRLDTVYTPQIVLNGRRQVVGADEAEVRREIRRAASRSPFHGRIRVLEITRQGILRLEVGVENGGDAPEGRILGRLALVQDSLVTPVSRGENARRTLENERVVRELRTVLELTPRTGESVTETVELALDSGWPTEDLGVVLFFQDPRSLEILGASSVGLDRAGAGDPRGR